MIDHSLVMTKAESDIEPTLQPTKVDPVIKKPRKKSSKPRCAIHGCKGRVVTLVGTCKWCSLVHCQEHRLPECHACKHIQACKQSASDINRRNLESCQAVAPKVVQV